MGVSKAQLRAWRHRRVQRWRDARPRRRARWASSGKIMRALLTLAISVLGAILISYGAWMIYAPVGYIVGGLMCLIIEWRLDKESADG